MSETNRKTIESYNNHAQEYIDGTPQKVFGFVKQWLDKSFRDVPKNAIVLEIGSAFGRDAKYLENAGYSVIRTDATAAFVDLLKNQGHDAHLLNVLIDRLPQEIDAVLANAVLLHFTSEETVGVIKKVYNALSNNGKFVFSVKQGTGEEWTEKKLGAPRYFRYWKTEELKTILNETGYSKIDISDGTSTDNTTWLFVSACK